MQDLTTQEFEALKRAIVSEKTLNRIRKEVSAAASSNNEATIQECFKRFQKQHEHLLHIIDLLIPKDRVEEVISFYVDSVVVIPKHTIAQKVGGRRIAYRKRQLR